ncbi:MAG: hypothetical protein GXO23_06555 [Crenarchaeota archaeon]|nr:hypothetical protein [Thermoproteota archaeon]
MLLGEFLIGKLKRQGVTDLHVDRKILRRIVRSGAEYFQWLSIMILQRRSKICIDDESRGRVIYEREGVKLLYGRGDVLSRYYVRWRSFNCSVDITEDFYNDLREFVYSLRQKLLFIIDLSFWDDHTEAEKRELVEQIVMCIKLLRLYLYDTCLVITSSGQEFRNYFNYINRDMYHEVDIRAENLREFLKKIIRTHRVAVLDPEGDHVLTEADVQSYNAFVIGGIVDKERVDKYGTYRLYNLYRLHELNIPRFRICLDCSTIGVPDRINRIMEIIIRCRMFNRSLKESIVESQTKKDRIYRWYYELQKHSRKIVKKGKIVRYVVSRELIEKLMREYPISQKDLEKIFRSLNVEITN